MATVKTIAIIDATTQMGSAIAKSLSRSDYRLLLMDDEQSKLDLLNAELVNGGATAELIPITCAKEASWEADVIILPPQYGIEQQLVEKVKQVAVGKIVISVADPSTSAHTRSAMSRQTSVAEELQKMLPYSKVVKAFNATFGDFIFPGASDRKVSTFIAGNNGEAVETVSRIVDAAGFNPIVAGDLSKSRELEKIELMIFARA